MALALLYAALIMAKLFLLTLIFISTTSFSFAANNQRFRNQSLSEASVKPKDEPELSTLLIEIQYAQSADVWSTVSNIRHAQGNLRAINEILQQKYGRPEEAFAVFKIRFNQPIDRENTFRFDLYTATEGLGFGLVQNPVVPELHASGIVVGTLGGGFQSKLGGSGPEFRLGGIAGMGREKRIDAISTDLIDTIPLRNGAVTLYGLDFNIDHNFHLERKYLLGLGIEIKETLFQTSTPLASASDDQNQRLLTSRWQMKSKLQRETDFTLFNRSWIAIEAIAGPQPLPVEVLPRVWDYAHSLYPFPELGAMFGAGLAFHGKFNNTSSLNSHFGYYGGYIGGDISARWKNILVSAATWGIENSSAYHILGTRIWQASVGFSI